MRKIALFLLIALDFPGVARAQDHTRQHMDHAAQAGLPATATPAVTESGQAAFGAIQEIVALLMADPDTDWSRVDIEALRQHLIDMDNVTLRASVVTEEVEDGARFLVSSDALAVTASIRTMVTAHVATINGVLGWHMEAEDIPGGAVLTVTGDPKRIRALGFIGIMTAGMHHQAHHLALASGKNPHAQ